MTTSRVHLGIGYHKFDTIRAMNDALDLYTDCTTQKTIDGYRISQNGVIICYLIA